MSQKEAGYILDRNKSEEYIDTYAGDTLLTESPVDSLWSITKDVDVVNVVSGDYYVLSGIANGVAPRNNYISSPVRPLTLRSGTSIHWHWDMKVNGPDALGLKAVFHRADTSLDDLTIETYGLSSEGIYFQGDNTDVYVVDLSVEHHFFVSLIADVYSIYIDGNLVKQVNADSTNSDATHDRMEFGIDGIVMADDIDDVYIKDMKMVYSSGASTGYNLLKSGVVTVTSNYSTTAFPISNVYNGFSNRPCVFSNNIIDFSMKSNFTYSDISEGQLNLDAVALLGHNISENAYITLSYGASMYSFTTIQIPWSKEEIIYRFSSAVRGDFVKVSISDPLNPDNIVISEVIIGEMKYFSECFFWGLSSSVEYNSIVHKTDYMAKWNYYLNRIKSLGDIDFGMVSDDTVMELYTLFEEANGSSTPILFLWDTRNERNGIIYGTLEDKFKNKLTFLDVNDVSKLKIEGLPYSKLIYDDGE